MRLGVVVGNVSSSSAIWPSSSQLYALCIRLTFNIPANIPARKKGHFQSEALPSPSSPTLMVCLPAGTRGRVAPVSRSGSTSALTM